MGAAPDGADHLLGLRRREDELHVLRRLLDDLEQRVEPLRGHHVRLVEDEDLVPVAGRREHGALAQVAGVVDAVVARRVDLDDVERAAAVAGQLDAAVALAARGVGRTLGTVEAAGQDARARRLAASAGSAEEVGVVHPIGAQRRAERIGHLRLADELGERLRAIAAVEGGDHGSRVVGAGDGDRPRRMPVDSSAAPRVAPSRPTPPGRKRSKGNRALAGARGVLRRIRLVAYGARLESVLGESPRGFESPILRTETDPPRRVRFWLSGYSAGASADSSGGPNCVQVPAPHW